MTVDDRATAVIDVERPTLYTLLDGAEYGDHSVVFQADAPGLSLFSATFG